MDFTYGNDACTRSRVQSANSKMSPLQCSRNYNDTELHISSWRNIHTQHGPTFVVFELIAMTLTHIHHDHGERVASSEAAANEDLNSTSAPRHSAHHAATLMWQDFVSKTRDIIQNNSGMLLIASSQAFYSLMDVSVKKLNSIQPPVPTLEVRAAFYP